MRPKAEDADSSRDWGNDTFDGDRFDSMLEMVQLKRIPENVGSCTIYIKRLWLVSLPLLLSGLKSTSDSTTEGQSGVSVQSGGCLV